jgi:hypothetical protein
MRESLSEVTADSSWQGAEDHDSEDRSLE